MEDRDLNIEYLFATYDLCDNFLGEPDGQGIRFYEHQNGDKEMHRGLFYDKILQCGQLVELHSNHR